MTTSRVLWALGLLLFLAMALVSWVEVRPLLFPEVAVEAPLSSSCDLRVGPCEAVFPGGARVAFELLPRSIPLVQDLSISVRIEGVDAGGVEVDFVGVDMNMGFNRVHLDPVGPGEFAGSGVLPVCVRRRMSWEAKVLLHTDVGLLAAPFRFETYRSGTPPPAL